MISTARPMKRNLHSKLMFRRRDSNKGQDSWVFSSEWRNACMIYMRRNNKWSSSTSSTSSNGRRLPAKHSTGLGSTDWTIASVCGGEIKNNKSNIL